MATHSPKHARSGMSEASELVASGRFLQALTSLDELKTAGLANHEADVLRAMLWEWTGRYSQSRNLASHLLQLNLHAVNRSVCEYVLGVIDWNEGYTDRGIEHLQRSTLLAGRAHDLERLCWSQLRLWTMLASRGDIHAEATVLADVRKNIIKLGNSHLLAALHVYVGEFEAKRGLMNSAQKHANTALHLLSRASNLWLEALAENINVGVAFVSLDVDGGLVHGRRAVTLAEQCGAAATLRACLANYGNLLYLSHRFDEAILYFERAVSALPSSGDNGNGAIDAIAAIRLAQGRITEAGELLDRIENSVRSPDDRKLYVFRHASLTRVRFLMQLGHWSEALARIDELTVIAREAGDRLLCAMTAFIRADILVHTQDVPESLLAISDVVESIPSLPPDFHAHYERLVASALALSHDGAGAAVHLDRARRIVTCTHSAPALIDLDRNWNTTRSRSNETPTFDVATDAIATRAKVTLQDAATLLLHAGHPEFLAREVVQILADASCVTHAVAVATDSSNARDVIYQIGNGEESALGTIDIGFAGTTAFRVEVAVKPDIESTATINAINFLLSAIRELDCARREREEHVRLWPTENLQVEYVGAIVVGEMQKLMSFAQRVAKTNVSVLITGESGTGKEILARAIHGYSARAEKPFVPFNCTAIPRDMLESQLFGHRRGAFTGADRDNPGLIRSAKEGTLFLDEIGELGLDLQPKLLRFLESGEICPLGEPRPFTVDVRIIAATNSNLEQLVQDGRFREDLFYRLNVIRLTIPPLRERRDEIPALVHHFVARAAAEFSKGRARVAEETMEHLLLYPWPGNVRQLQNEMRRMVALADVDAVLTPAALAPDIRSTIPTPAPRAGGTGELAVPLNDKLLPTLSRIEREMIKVALHAHQGRVDQAAKALGISRKGLYLKRQRLGL